MRRVKKRAEKKTFVLVTEPASFRCHGLRAASCAAALSQGEGRSALCGFGGRRRKRPFSGSVAAEMVMGDAVVEVGEVVDMDKFVFLRSLMITELKEIDYERVLRDAVVLPIAGKTWGQDVNESS